MTSQNPFNPPPPVAQQPTSAPSEAAPARNVRKRLAFWDRVKFLALFALLFLFVVSADVSGDPLMTWSDALRQEVRGCWYLIALFALELVRQIHMFLGERSSGYYTFWTESVFGRFEGRLLRLNDWNRYRASRTLKWVIGIVVALFIYARARHDSFFHAIVNLPGDIWSAAPFVLQISLIVLLGIGQFAAIFWFMSKGGVDVYFPEDIKTRFSDVWGQDHVISRVKEAVFFLERPTEIESRGGHVPGGILLWGPPGTGKTLIAEAVAGETGKPFVFIDPGAFSAMFFGVGILKVKSLFRKLRKLSLRYGGVIAFFDEADTLGNRGQLSGGFGGQFSPDFAAATTGLRFDHTPACNGVSYASDSTRRQLAIPQFVMPNGGGGGQSSFDGSLQALLTEMSGLKKPRGFINRVVRRTLGMRPKPPPKYRIMIMMATNMPQALDEALLRPGRIDRIYKVGYPSKEGRIRTYRGYLDRVNHELTDEEVDKLAIMTPYATGATIKDTVNEGLIQAIRAGRETINWQDILRAKAIKEHGLPDDHAYVEKERHSVALHEACHAVVMYRLLKNKVIDMATIERRGGVGGFVAPVPLEDRFVDWKSEIEADVMTFLASIVGERMFFENDHTQGVGGDLAAATEIITRSIGVHGMGSTLISRPALAGGVGGNNSFTPPIDPHLRSEVEAKLQDLYQKTERLLAANRREVLAVTHALESHKTISGDDVAAVIEGREGPMVDGRRYNEPDFMRLAEDYHETAVGAHRGQLIEQMPLPDLDRVAASRASQSGTAQSTPAQSTPGQSTPGQSTAAQSTAAPATPPVGGGSN
jgi:cell division protease FtsH